MSKTGRATEGTFAIGEGGVGYIEDAQLDQFLDRGRVDTPEMEQTGFDHIFLAACFR